MRKIAKMILSTLLVCVLVAPVVYGTDVVPATAVEGKDISEEVIKALDEARKVADDDFTKIRWAVERGDFVQASNLLSGAKKQDLESIKSRKDKLKTSLDELNAKLYVAQHKAKNLKDVKSLKKKIRTAKKLSKDFLKQGKKALSDYGKLEKKIKQTSAYHNEKISKLETEDFYKKMLRGKPSFFDGFMEMSAEDAMSAAVKAVAKEHRAIDKISKDLDKMRQARAEILTPAKSKKSRSSRKGKRS